MEQGVTGIKTATILQPHHNRQALLQQRNHKRRALVRVGLGELAAQELTLAPLIAAAVNIKQRLQHGRLTVTKLGCQLGPVIVEHGYATRPAPLQQQSQGPKGLRRWKQANPQGGKAALKPLRHAGPAPRPPLHREQRPIVCSGRQAIESAIGRGIAGLPGGSEQSGHR